MKTPFHARIRSLPGLLAGAILTWFARSPAPPQPDDLARADFPTSTQRMGVSFTDRIRDVFRFKWIRKL